MALGAAKALKARFNCALFLGVLPRYRALARACEHVDDVFTSEPALNRAIAQYPPETVLGRELTAYMASVSPDHQIDVYLEACGISAPARLKEIELRLDPGAETQADAMIASWPALASGTARILIHPATGDPNRTWPRSRWEELAARLIAAGHQVVVIGSRSARSDRGVHDLTVSGLVTAVDRLQPLATVALMRHADVLVSTDGGPVQLAGATDIGIVGIYSVVAGKHRLPFRHGEAGWRARAVSPVCPAHPCIQGVADPAVRERIDRTLREQPGSNPLGEWCVMPQRYHCLTHEITVSMVLDACRDLLPASPD